MTSVVVFSGGRGATTILTSLARTRNVDLFVVVNAYDAGLSTGRVRRAFAGMLGPSDLRKTAGTLALAVGDDRSRALASLFEHRLVSGGDSYLPADIRARDQLTALAQGQIERLGMPIAGLLRGLALETWLEVRDALVSFDEALQSGPIFSYEDLAIGNAVLAGLFVKRGQLRDAFEDYQNLLGLREQRVSNATRGEDLWLSARAGDMFCPDEGTLVAAPPPHRISDLFLLERADHDRIYRGQKEWLRRSDLGEDPAASEALPYLDPYVERKISEADVIVYGPGTQHSSLLPTYLTIGLAEIIVHNSDAEKIFVANIERDNDQYPDETSNDALDNFLRYISRRGTIDAALEQYVTTVLVGDRDGESLRNMPLGVRVRRAVWADPGGKHSGPAVQEEIASVIRLRSGEQLPGDSGLASIIVPVLDELPRVPAVLQQLRYLDLGELGMVQEIIVVDGGSSDGTVEFLREEPDITLIEAHCRGRGDAIRAGLQRARGDYVVSFPSDGEYDVATVTSVLRELHADPEAAVLASRALGGSSAGQRLREVYSDNELLYMLSHWGGVAVTLLLMLRLDRVVSDPLSGIRGARRNVFRQLDNASSGLDYDVRWVRRAVEAGRRLIEVPTNYKPRSWRDGKKTSLFDGLRALASTLGRNDRMGR